MAEYCLDCWNKINDTNDPAKDYIISKEPDLCEGCGQMKPVVIMRRADYSPKWINRILCVMLLVGITLIILAERT